MEFWPIIKVIRNFDQIPKLILFILLNEISPLISYLFQWKWLLLCLFSRMHWCSALVCLGRRYLMDKLLRGLTAVHLSNIDYNLNNLKSLKVVKWRKDEWRMMKEWRMNEWRMKDEGWWFQAVKGYWLRTDRQNYGHLWMYIKPTPPQPWYRLILNRFSVNYCKYIRNYN